MIAIRFENVEKWVNAIIGCRAQSSERIELAATTFYSDEILCVTRVPFVRSKERKSFASDRGRDYGVANVTRTSEENLWMDNRGSVDNTVPVLWNAWTEEERWRSGEFAVISCRN